MADFEVFVDIVMVDDLDIGADSLGVGVLSLVPNLGRDQLA